MGFMGLPDTVGISVSSRDMGEGDSILFKKIIEKKRKKVGKVSKKKQGQK